jgi:hypothetical protein
MQQLGEQTVENEGGGEKRESKISLAQGADSIKANPVRELTLVPKDPSC